MSERPTDWDLSPPRERADSIRHHLSMFGLGQDYVRDLFQLTDEGLEAIVAGDVWRPEYRTKDTTP